MHHELNDKITKQQNVQLQLTKMLIINVLLPRYKYKKPSWCWDSQPSVGIFGNFFNFRQQHSNMVRREPA